MFLPNYYHVALNNYCIKFLHDSIDILQQLSACLCVILFIITVTCQWSVIQAVNEYGEVLSDNDLPAGRYAHACSLDGNIMYIQVNSIITLLSLSGTCI